MAVLPSFFCPDGSRFYCLYCFYFSCLDIVLLDSHNRCPTASRFACQLYSSKSTIRRNCKGCKAVEDTGMNFIMIKWDIDNLRELDCLPSVLYLDDEDEDMVYKLSDAYGYCIKEYRILDKEDVLKCLADEILQNSFNKTFSGNYYTYLSEVQNESMERFHYELNEKDKSEIFDLICQDFYLLDANWDEDDGEEYYDLMLGYGRINNGYEFDDGCKDEKERYDLRQNLLDDLRVKTPLAYDALNCSLTLPDGGIIENVLSKLQANKLYEDFLYDWIDVKYPL